MNFQEGQTATHKDGRKIIFKGGQWRLFAGNAPTANPGGQPRLLTKPMDPQKYASLKSMEQQIERVQALYRKGPGWTKGISSLLDYMPTPSNQAFDAAGAGLGEIGLAAFRVPGSGSQSDNELKAFLAANRPFASDIDEKQQEKLRNLSTRLTQTYKAYGLSRDNKPLSNGGGGFEFLGFEGE